MEEMIGLLLKELPVAAAMLAVVIVFMRHIAETRRENQKLMAKVLEVVDRNTSAWVRAEEILDRLNR